MEKMIKKKMTLKFLNRLFRFISITIMISSHHLYICIFPLGITMQSLNCAKSIKPKITVSFSDFVISSVISGTILFFQGMNELI